MQKVLSWSLIVQFLLLPAGPISFADEATLETESTHFISISKNSEESAICPAPSYNNVETEEEEQAHCNVSLENSNPSTNSAALVSDAKKILSDDIDAPKLCSDEFYAKQKITSKDKKDFKDHLQQICYKQFKHHKKKFAKQLLKNGHIFRALTVLLKRKKKYA